MIKRMNIFLIVSLVLGLCAPAHAQDGELTTAIRPPRIPDDQYSSFMRVTLVGAGVLGSNGGSSKGFGSGLFADFGRKRFSVEGGVQYINTPVTVQLTNPYGFTADGRTQLDAQYLGPALFVKYNYFEGPMSVFSAKVGAMPAFLINAGETTASYTNDQYGGQTVMEPNDTDIFGMIGFTGTAPLNDTLAFVVDGTYYQGFEGIDANGTRSQGFLLGIGLRMAL